MPHSFRKDEGFTLIELMIVVTIIGILSAIALPSYAKMVLKGHRSDATKTLLEVQVRQQKFFTNNNSYGETMTRLGLSSNPILSEGGYYSIAVTATPAGCAPGGTSCQGYTLRATPQGKQADDDCGYLEIDHFGRRTSENGLKECWGI